jgi:hypothetical protein
MTRSIAERKAARQSRHRQDAERRARIEQEHARIEGARQEAIAPAAQRKPVLTVGIPIEVTETLHGKDGRTQKIHRRVPGLVSGTVYRAPLAVPDGVAFRRSSPLCHLFKRQAGITTDHLKAAARLQEAWETGGRGVGMGASNYQERTSGVAKSGISDAVLSSIGRQNVARDEFMVVRWRLGHSWKVIEGIVLDGMDVTTWAANKRPQCDYRTAEKLLVVALDRLVKVYESFEPDKPKTIRSV